MRNMTLKKLYELEETEEVAQNISMQDPKQRFIFRKKINQMYEFIMSKITLMRQLCCHSLLYNYKSHSIPFDRYMNEYEKFLNKKGMKTFVYFPQKAEKIKLISKGEQFPCELCGEFPQDGLLSECLHVFCKTCIVTHIRYEQLNEDSSTKYSSNFEESMMSLKKTKIKDRIKDF